MFSTIHVNNRYYTIRKRDTWATNPEAIISFTDKEWAQIKALKNVIKIDASFFLCHIMRVMKQKIADSRKDGKYNLIETDEKALLSLFYYCVD